MYFGHVFLFNSDLLLDGMGRKAKYQFWTFSISLFLFLFFELCEHLHKKKKINKLARLLNAIRYYFTIRQWTKERNCVFLWVAWEICAPQKTNLDYQTNTHIILKCHSTDSTHRLFISAFFWQILILTGPIFDFFGLTKHLDVNGFFFFNLQLQLPHEKQTQTRAHKINSIWLQVFFFVLF